MASVIAETCIGTKDTACVDACPVDRIDAKGNISYDDSRPGSMRFRNCTSTLWNASIAMPACRSVRCQRETGLYGAGPRGKGCRSCQEAQGARTRESIFAFVCRGAQPAAMDQGRRSSAGRCSEDNARACSQIQRREDQASRSGRRFGSARRRNVGSKSAGTDPIPQGTNAVMQGQEAAMMTSSSIRKHAGGGPASDQPPVPEPSYATPYGTNDPETQNPWLPSRTARKSGMRNVIFDRVFRQGET